MSGDVFAWTEQTIMSGIDTALSGQTAVYGGMIAPVITGWAALYVVISGYKALAGKLQTPLPDVVWNLGVMGILLAFVTNAGGWFDMVNTAIDGVRTGLGGDDNGIWGQLDSLWESGQKMAETLMDADKDMLSLNLSGQLARILTWIGVSLVTFPAAVLNLSAEIMLKLLLTTGPLFVACLAFGWFRAMFENWMKAIMSSLLAILFSSLGVGVVIRMMNSALAQTPEALQSNIITTGVMLLGAGVMGFVVTGLAAKLAGSLAGSGVSAAAAGIAAGAGVIGAGMAMRKAAPGAVKAYDLAGKTGEKMGDAANWLTNKMGEGNNLREINSYRNASIENMKRLNK